MPSLKIKKRPAVKIFINSKEEVIPSGNCVLKKDGTMAFNDGGQEVRREKLMTTDKNTSRISQEELEEFFKRPMSHTTEYKIKDFAEALEKSKNDILIQDKRKG